MPPELNSKNYKIESHSLYYNNYNNNMYICSDRAETNWYMSANIIFRKEYVTIQNA
jgi:hypothetical protein